MDAGEPTLSVPAAPVVAQPERFWLSTGSHRTQERERERALRRLNTHLLCTETKGGVTLPTPTETRIRTTSYVYMYMTKLYNKTLTCHESGGYYKTNGYTISYEMGTGEGESSGPPGPRRPPLVTPRRRWSVPVPLRPPFSNRPPRETLSIEERKSGLQVPPPECGRTVVVETPKPN